MKTNQDPLDRLFRAAARAPGPAPENASFALEAKVMGAWRSAAQSSNGDAFVVWLRRAAICACLLAVMSLAWNYGEPARNQGDGDELAVADAAMRVGVEP